MALILPQPPVLSAEADEDTQVIFKYMTRVYNALRGRVDIPAVGITQDSPFQRITLPETAATPGTPTGLTAFGFYKQIFLVWDYDPNPAIDSWEVSRSTAAGGTYTVRTHARTFTFLDEELNVSETWFYKVRAMLVNGTSFSALTASATATTQATDAGVMALLPTAAAAVQAAATI